MYTSTFRTLHRTLTIASVLLGTTGIAVSATAQTGPAPVLIPYTINLIAGNAQSPIGAYTGDGSRAIGTALKGPSAVALDPEGNVYIADTANAVIREVNAQTGVIRIIAGMVPTGCTAGACTATLGYADNVPATSVGIGGATRGLAVDGYGNVFFSDANQLDIRVVYKGGAQVAKFISTVDPTAAPTPDKVVPGNIYLIAGQPNGPSTGNGAAGTKATAVDNVLATKATFGVSGSLTLGQIGLDSAGNIYVQDAGFGVVRVINAQPTATTILGYTIQPGFIQAVVGCNATMTVPCPSVNGIGLPAKSALYTSALAGMAVDQYGNVYEANGKGSQPNYGGVAYAGGAPLAHLLQVEGFANLTQNNWYSVINANPDTAAPALPSALSGFLANHYSAFVLRGTALTIDPLGNIYFMDNHWLAIYRIDVNSQVVTKMNSTVVTTGTTAVPAPCSTTISTLTSDIYGDGCPLALTRLSGLGGMTTDAAGNVYFADQGENLVRKLSVNSQFPASQMGIPVVQMIQVHFDQNNLPVTSTATTTTPITLASGSTDFSILTAPTCVNATKNGTVAADASIDCIVPVTFNPTRPGLVTGTLLATAANGVVYRFALTGTGTGSLLAVDGGSQVVIPTAGLGQATNIAVDVAGTTYISDGSNNRVVVLPAGGGAQTTLKGAAGLSNPTGVAVDALGNVYLNDSGNGRALMINPISGVQTIVATGLSTPQGITVDPFGNVYIADTGNKRIVEVASHPASGTSVLRQFNNLSVTDGLSNPVGIASDTYGNIYVADSAARSIFVLPPGGGDFQNLIGPVAGGNLIPIVGSNLVSPTGVAVDAAGDVYFSDSSTNTVCEKPSSTGPGSEQFCLSFSGLKSPAGLAVDRSGNVFVVDAGNSRIVEMPRSNVSVNFGNLALFQPALTLPITIGNIGNSTYNLVSPPIVTTGNTANFTLTDKPQEGCAGLPLLSGLTCGYSAGFLPVDKVSYAEKIVIQPAAGGATSSSVTLLGVGIPSLGAIALAFTQTPVIGVTTAAVTATVTQPHGPNTPTGSVTFVTMINEGNTARGGSTQTVTVNLIPGSGGASTATLNLTGLLPARRYSVVATYSGDAADTTSTAPPFTFIVPGGQTLSIVANPVTFAYGQPIPTLIGTVTGILPADAATVTYVFTTPASATTPVGTYPISLILSGGNYLNYVVPAALTSAGAPALVTETPAPLTVSGNSFTTTYGAQNITPTSVITGVVNGDVFTTSYSPAKSQFLDVGKYILATTLIGPTANYSVKLTNGTLTVGQAAAAVATAINAATVLPTNLASIQLAIAVVSSTSGTPSGTVTLTDTFTPLDKSAANAPVTIGPLTLTNGSAIYVPTSPALGTHIYVAFYSGDINFVATTSGNISTIVVTNPDFTVVAPSNPLAILPGIIPGGNQNVPGQSAATPEQATITFNPLQGYTGTVNITCTSPSSYVTCALSATSVVMAGTTPQTVVISVSTPATLPIDYAASLGRFERASDPRLCMIPLGLLALLPLAGARRKRLTRYVWALVGTAILGLGLSGCSPVNLVKFYTPIPRGDQTLTITATDGKATHITTMLINIQ